MEAVWTLLIVTNPIFWILTAVVFGFIVWAVDWEKGFVATILLAGFCALVYFFGNGKDVVTWSIEHPYNVLWHVLEFVACGVVWATVHWIIRCFERKHEYQDMLAHWLDMNGLDTGLKAPPPEKMRDWLESLCNRSVSRSKCRWCDYQGSGKDRTYTPRVKLRARDFKVDITRDMFWWIPSMFWWLCSGFIMGFYARLQRYTAGFYNWISDWIFHGIEMNLQVPKPEEKKVVKGSQNIVAEDPPYVR